MISVKTVRASEVRSRIGDILARVRYGREHVIVEKRGKPVAAIISIDEYDRLLAVRRQ